METVSTEQFSGGDEQALVERYRSPSPDGLCFGHLPHSERWFSKSIETVCQGDLDNTTLSLLDMPLGTVSDSEETKMHKTLSLSYRSWLSCPQDTRTIYRK